jgi:hypothetical protein
MSGHAQSKEDSQNEITLLRAQLSSARAEIAKLLPYAKRVREMPVKLSARKALMGSGLVLQVKSFSLTALPAKVTLISPTFGKTNTFDLVIDAAQVTPTTKEIGHAEGWAGAPGDWIIVESQGYDPVKEHF